MTANYFGISETGTSANWKAILITCGFEVLFRPKGKPQQEMKKSKLSKETKDLTREQQLEEEIKLFRIENKYLKKCHSHGSTPWSQRIKSEQESFKNQ